MPTRAKRKAPVKPEPLRQLADGRWRFRIYSFGTKNGPRKLTTLPRGTSRLEAVAKYRAELAKAAARAGKPAPRRFTLAEVGPDFLSFQRTRGVAPATLGSQENILRLHLVPAFGTRRLDSIRPPDVEAWQAQRIEEGAAPGSVNLATQLLRTILRRCEAWGWIDKSPLPAGSVRRRPGSGEKTDFLRPDEWRAFSTALDDPLLWEAWARKVRSSPRKIDPRLYRRQLEAALVLFHALLFTACRISEVAGLRWQDVDLAAGRLNVPMGKVRQTKVLPIGPELRAVFDSLPRGTPAAPVFLAPDGRAWDLDQLRRLFSVLRRLAGLREGITPHTLRHTAASWMVAAGTPLTAVRDALGHSDLAMTARYSHSDLSTLTKAFDVLGAVEKSGKRQPGANLKNAETRFRQR